MTPYDTSVETRSVITRSAEETRRLAADFGKNLVRGDVVALYGELGSGKTQFVRGICTAFHVHEHVASPTFIILNRYRGTDRRGEEIVLHHLDLYRVASLEEVYDLGYEEFLFGDGITLIEWAERLEGLLPEHRFDVRLALGREPNERCIEIRSRAAERGAGGTSEPPPATL